MSERANGNVGFGVLDVLGIMFIILKVTDTINWAWWMVLIPFYIDLGLAAIGVAIYLSKELIRKRREKKAILAAKAKESEENPPGGEPQAEEAKSEEAEPISEEETKSEGNQTKEKDNETND